MKGLAKILSEQDGAKAENGRVAVINFESSGVPSLRILQRSNELKEVLSLDGMTMVDRTCPEGEKRYDVRRRLFILEDLPRTFVELLGSHLRINPAFFARHCTDLSFLESYDDLPTERKEVRQLYIPFMHFMNAPRALARPDRDLAELYCASFNVRRILAWPKPYGGWDLRGTIGELECCISYWGVNYDGGGWDGK